jgi:hypothetical protein
MAHLERSLAFERHWPPLMWFGLPAWLLWTIWSKGLYSDSPPWPSCRFLLWAFFRVVYASCILCIYCILFTFCITLCFPMINSTIIRIFLLNCLTTNYCRLSLALFNFIISYLITVLLLFHYCHYSDPGKACQVFRSLTEVTITCNLDSINIILGPRRARKYSIYKYLKSKNLFTWWKFSDWDCFVKRYSNALFVIFLYFLNCTFTVFSKNGGERYFPFKLPITPLTHDSTVLLTPLSHDSDKLGIWLLQYLISLEPDKFSFW